MVFNSVGNLYILSRLMKTRFYYAYTYRFKQAVQIYSLTHYAKGTPASTLYTNLFFTNIR